MRKHAMLVGVFAIMMGACSDDSTSLGAHEAGAGQPEAYRGLGASREGAGPHELHDPGCTRYVSSSQGNDQWDGTAAEHDGATSGPWKTFAPLMERETALQAGESLCLRRGDTFRETLQFRPCCGPNYTQGEPGKPLTVQPYGWLDESKPSLNGGTPIAGEWLPAGVHPNIYVVDLSEMMQDRGESFVFHRDGKAYTPHDAIWRLYLDGEPLTLARYPNLRTGDSEPQLRPYDRSEQIGRQYNVLEDGNSDARTYVDSTIMTRSRIWGDVDWTGASLQARSIGWISISPKVVAFDPARRELSLSGSIPCDGDRCSGYGYFLNNHLAALDEPGEWYYDEETKRLYLWTPEGDHPQEHSVEASIYVVDRDRGELNHLGRQGSSGIRVGSKKHLVIRDLEIRQWSGTGVDAFAPNSGSEDVLFADLDLIGNQTAIAVTGRNPEQPVRITNSIMRNSGCNAVVFWAAGSELDHNTIERTGMMEQLSSGGLFHCGVPGLTPHETGAAVHVGRGQNGMHVHHNLVRDVGSNGLHFEGGETLLEYNLVERACQTKMDCGGIRSFGVHDQEDPESDFARTDTTQGSVVQHNVVLNTLGTAEGLGFPNATLGQGMFFDVRVHGVTIRDNVVANSSTSGIHMQNDRDMVVERNLLYNNSNHNHASAAITFKGCELATCPLTLNDNVIFGTSPSQRAATISATVFEARNNHYLNPYIQQLEPREYNAWNRPYHCLIESKEGAVAYVDTPQPEPMCRNLSSWREVTGQESGSVTSDYTWTDRVTTVVLGESMVPNGDFATDIESWSTIQGPQVRGIRTILEWQDHTELGPSLHAIKNGGNIDIRSEQLRFEPGTTYEVRLLTLGTQPYAPVLEYSLQRVGDIGMGAKLIPVNDRPVQYIEYLDHDSSRSRSGSAQTEEVVTPSWTLKSDGDEVWIAEASVRPVLTEYIPKSVVLKAGELPPPWARSLLYYNPTVDEQTIELQGWVFYDAVDGSQVKGSFELPPMGGRILVAGPKAWLGETAGDFGEVAERQERVLVVTSVGSLPLKVESVELTSASGAFQLLETSCNEAQLDPSWRCEVRIAFEPNASQTRGGLEVKTNDPNRPVVAIELKGAAR